MAFDPLDSLLMAQFMSMLCQTFFYGVYFCLFPIFVYVMITKGLKTRPRKWLFAMIVTMFALSTVYWIICIVYIFIVIDMWRDKFGPGPIRRLPNWLGITIVLPMVNNIITDGVVIWRAWMLCPGKNLLNRVVLIIPVIVLALNTLLYLLTVALCAVAITAFGEGQILRGIHLSNVINTMQLINLGLSLLANIIATSIIAVKAWRYRKTLMTNGDGIRTPTRAIKILGLVVESGLLYILIGVVALVSPFIDLPTGTLSEIFAPSTGQLAGMYPIVVLLLVETKRSLDMTYFSSSSFADVRGGQRSQMGPMNFAAGPALATNTQIQIEIESQASQPRVNDHNGEPVKTTSLSLYIS